MTLFQSTPPVKAATVYTFCIIFNCDISIHAAREGGDAVIAVYRDIPHIFQSTPPVKAATQNVYTVRIGGLFQSTPPVKAATIIFAVCRTVYNISIHAAREGGDWYGSAGAFFEIISIHAAREGGDDLQAILFSQKYISIHAAREGGDLMESCTCFIINIFKSTPPVKAATWRLHRPMLPQQFQSTPPVKAATDGLRETDSRRNISIHAAREGGDEAMRRQSRVCNHFNPRRP